MLAWTRRLVCLREAAAKSCQRGFYEIPEGERLPVDSCMSPILEALREWRPLYAKWCAEMPTIPLWDESNPWLDTGYRYAAVSPEYTPDSHGSPDSVLCFVSISRRCI